MTRGDRPRAFGFVMEQTLGHITHYRNLRATVDDDASVAPTWYPVTFPPRGTWETLPVVRSNWSVRASWRARRLLQRDNAAGRLDALFFHTQVTTLLSAGLMQRVPTVISLDATPINYDVVGAAYGHAPSSGPLEKVKRSLNKRTLHAASALVTWCAWARQSLIDDYDVEPSRITVVAPGVDLARWPRPSAARAGTNSPLRLLFVGADFERKGGAILLDAFEGLDDRYELHLVTKAAVDARPGVHVYRDLAPNSTVLKKLYAESDLFVLPTLADCFPVAIQEALAAGLPVVSTRMGAIPEAVREGETGVLVPPGDGAALRAALLRLAHDAPLRRVMSARGRALAESEYDSAANARRILAVMTTAARASRASAAKKT